MTCMDELAISTKETGKALNERIQVTPMGKKVMQETDCLFKLLEIMTVTTYFCGKIKSFNLCIINGSLINNNF